MRRFELVEGASAKFWQVEVDGLDVTTSWGRLGTNGQSKTKTHSDAAAAAAEERKLIEQKTKKGYAEVAAALAPIAEPAKAPAPAPVAGPPAAPARDVGPVAASESAEFTDGTPPWLAHGDPFLLDESFVAAAHPSRAHPHAAPPPRWEAEWRTGLVADTARTAPHLRSLLEATLAVEAVEDATEEQALGVLAIVATGRSGPDYAVRTFAAKFGVVRAAELLVKSYAITAERGYGREGPVSFLDVPQERRLGLGRNESSLREVAALASDEEYAGILAVVRDAWPRLTPPAKAALALALPDQPDLSDELIEAYASDRTGWLPALQATASTPELAAIAARASEFGILPPTDAGLINALVVERGSAAAPYLLPHVAKGDVADAIARIGTPDAVRALVAPALEGKEEQARLRSAVERWPIAATVALADAAVGEGRVADLARAALGPLLAAQSDLATRVEGWVSTKAADVVASTLARVTAVVEEADSDELPPVLATPPWLTKKKPTVLELDVIQVAPVEDWAEGLREEWLKNWSSYGYRRAIAVDDFDDAVAAICRPRWGGHPTETDELREAQERLREALRDGDADLAADRLLDWSLAVHAAQRRFRDSVVGGIFVQDAAAVLGEIREGFGLELWNAVAGRLESDDEVPFVVATHGAAALRGLARVTQRRPAELSSAAPIGAVELAPVMARAALKLKSVRAEAYAWLRRYPEHSAAGLIAPALGAKGEARDAARSALQTLAADPAHRRQILEVADRYEDAAVAAAVAELVDADATENVPARIAKLPSWWAPATWVRPELRSGKALPLASVDHLGKMLMFPSPDGAPYAGITQVAEAGDPRSVADFGWDLFLAWLNAGAASKDSWAMTSLGWLGGDDIARRITPYLRAWPGEGQHKRAVAGLDVLERIGTDLALVQLNGIATKVKFKALQERAKEKIAQIAEARGLTSEELADRLAPDLGLDARGSKVLDFGGRTFTVGFDEALKPFVRDVDGARLKELPKSRQSDDAALAAEATAQWKALKKDARTIAAQQVLRLEIAMCARRRWTRDVFEQFLATHPLVRHLVRRLLWATYAGDAPATFFAVDDDGGYTDAADEAIDLPVDAVIGIPHAWEIPEEVASDFGALFLDYELVQPFSQLGRETFALSAAEAASTKLTRWAGRDVPTGKVLGLTNRGWRRGVPADGGVVGYVEKETSHGRVIASLDPGLFTGMLDEAPEQRVVGVQVGQPDAWDEVSEPSPLSTLSAIEISEVIRDLDALSG